MEAIKAALSSTDRAQAEGVSCEWYSLLNLQGKGEFVKIMDGCIKSKDFTAIDTAIKDSISQYLYNGGEGKMVSASEIVRIRQRIRYGADFEDREHVYSAPVRANKVGSRDAVMVEAGDTTDHGKNPQRLVCWDLTKRGSVGETLLHLCLLQRSELLKELAKRLLAVFPKLFVDIYVSDQYFGENILHIAIANEVEDIVKIILDLDKEGTSLKERAFGIYFNCVDQIDKRADIRNSELIVMPPSTNYEGYMYFGEYPLSFAACVGNKEILTLLKAHKLKQENFEAQDHNGNTVLHLLVIRNDKDTYDFVLSMIPEGVDVSSIKNNKGLTPVTLAAAIGRKDMYDHLMKKKRQISWTYGEVTCADYPLDCIDSIGRDGEINTKSALHLIISGTKPEYLEMVDPLMKKLLTQKWEGLRSYFYRRLLWFCVYFCFITAAMALRPGRDVYAGTRLDAGAENGSYVPTNETMENHNCYLFGPPQGIPYKTDDVARLILEALTIIGVICYVGETIWDIRTNGWRTHLHMLVKSPTTIMFYLSWLGVALMMLLRAFCSLHLFIASLENIVADATMMLTAPHFLFYGRGFQPIGPVVSMVRKMLIKDFGPFIFIYAVFLIGFSQAMYVAHIGYSPPDNSTTPFRNTPESMMGMLYMSMGEFVDMYEALDYTKHENLGKFMFILYMVLVTFLLINLLIAMMGNTYTLVNERQKEGLRQWAHIVLAIEQTVSPAKRLMLQEGYSVKTASSVKTANSVKTAKDKLVMPFRWHHTAEEINALKEKKDQTKKEHEAIIRCKSAKAASAAQVQNIVPRSARQNPEES